MKLGTITFALLVGACMQKDDDKDGSQDLPDDTDVSGDTDTGEDTDTATDTDTDTDTDTSPDTDTATDTGMDTATPSPCSVEDLEYRVEVRDDAGQPSESFSTTDMPTLAGLLVNTCSDGPVHLETDTTCLVKKWTIVGPDDVEKIIEPLCTPETTGWNIAADGSAEATYKMEPMPLAGDYDVTVEYGFGSETQETSFTIEEPEATPEEEAPRPDRPKP